MGPLFGFLALSQAADGDPALAIAGSRAGEVGVIDLQFVPHQPVAARLWQMAELSRGPWGVLVGDEDVLATVLKESPQGLTTVVIGAGAGAVAGRLGPMIAQARGARIGAWATVTSVRSPRASAPRSGRWTAASPRLRA